jgi:hypothetical protein
MENIPNWMQELSDEDWQFIKRLVLASGSLKEVAAQYGISYPTVRVRMDRIIEKMEILESQNHRSRFHMKLQLMVAEGQLDFATAKKLLKLHEEENIRKE